ncbi:MAG: protein-(glutamine-N5) methyltransferase, release factor-specific [Chloroflexi bacterium RIFCSPLOWO2_02_FULL_71_16]|nr:MAG: protein-(glutamine-N5) methyltransferase, release factor-specific [Chloroflexi bacterium RIFCSPLOWO2_02_FULL_71_16]
MTRGQARANGLARLRASDDPSPALAADLLLADACGIAKEVLYAHLDEALPPDREARYRELIERRAAGEPVAYLRGWKEFFGLRFAVDDRVLIPRPETETLVEAALAYLRAGRRRRVADVGTGSGAIAVAIAVNEPEARVIATELSSGALEVARANIRAHGVERRVDVRVGDLLDPVEEGVDVVTANLPYLRADALDHLTAERTSLLFEPRAAVLAGGDDALDVIRRAVAQLPGKLAPGGAAFFECDPPQAGAVAELLAAALGGPTLIIRDLMGNERVVRGTRPG